MNDSWGLDLDRFPNHRKLCVCGEKGRLDVVNETIILSLLWAERGTIDHVFFYFVKGFACCVRDHSRDVLLVNLQTLKVFIKLLLVECRIALNVELDRMDEEPCMRDAESPTSRTEDYDAN